MAPSQASWRWPMTGIITATTTSYVAAQRTAMQRKISEAESWEIQQKCAAGRTQL